jgi:pimeloyl-ACP methyl ester carboxylesterase
VHLILANGVYGAPEHFGALQTVLEPRLPTKVFTFTRLGQPDPSPGAGFGPMIDRLDAVVRGSPGPVAVLGFSLGGALALDYALLHGERLAALVLVNAFDRFQVGHLAPGSIPPVWRVPVHLPHRGIMSRIVHALPWLRRGLFHPDATLADIERVMAQSAASTADDLRFQLAHLCLPLPEGHRQRLAKLAETVPVLLVCSRDDLIVHPAHTARLAESMPAARRLPPFVGGHGFFQHNGTALANAVIEFLAEVEATHPAPPEPGGDGLD